MTIRPAQPAEDKPVLELVRGILSKEFPTDRDVFDTGDLENLSQAYSGPANVFLVAEEDNQIVGTCGVKAESPQTAILRRLFVDKNYRGQGIGSQLLKEALEFCRSRGYREVVIRTSTQMEQAIRLCRSLGFQEEGRWRMGSSDLIRFRLRL